MKIKQNITILLTYMLFFSSLAYANPPIRLATTTSTYHSGLLDYLLPQFTRETGYKVIIHAAGTGRALRMGENGDVDIIITHAPKAEAAFVENGFGILPRPLMYNDFVLLGPTADPANIQQSKNIKEALLSIAKHNANFISRGDDSGTHKKEQKLWQDVGIQPQFIGYKAIGQGMGPALTMANELQAYTLTDRGTWIAYQTNLDLAILLEGDEQLFNPYQVIIVNPKRHLETNSQGAMILSNWLISNKTQKLINDFQINGQHLFIANYAP